MLTASILCWGRNLPGVVAVTAVSSAASLLVALEPVPDWVIDEIVDSIFLPLVRPPE